MKVKLDLTNHFPTSESLKGDYDLFINGFNGCERVSYRKELKGESNNLKEIATLSKKYDKSIISAFDTDNYGIIKRSAGVFDKGKLLGVSDATVSYEYSGYMPSAGGKLYDLSCGKIALAVCDDIYSFGLFKSFAVCGAELTIAITNDTKKEINSILIRAYSFLLGVPTILLFCGGAYISDVKGNLTVVDLNGEDTFTIQPYFEYVLKTTKTRLNR